MNNMTRLSCGLIVSALVVVGCSPEKPAPAPELAGSSSPSEWSADRKEPVESPSTKNPATTGVEMVPQKPSGVEGTTPVDPKAKAAIKLAVKDLKDKKIDQIPVAGTWNPNKSDVMKLLATADSNLTSLKNARMSFKLLADLPEGRGEVNLDTIVADNKRYLLRYARFEMLPQPHFETYIVTDRKGEEVTLVGQNYVPGRQSIDSDILRGWERNSTHYIASTVGTNRKPLTDLVTAAKKAGWKITSEGKVFQQGLSFTRVLLTSNDAQPLKYELMINNAEKLPVSFRAERRGSKKVSVVLNIGWAFNTKPLTAEDLNPKVAVDSVKVFSPEEIAKMKTPQKPIF
ncbi:MAG TPA: hypothetical protein VK171_12230 [Fimbriimonas sp.]|nr:hypothetical protein [Fimbriimonas sp.]